MSPVNRLAAKLHAPAERQIKKGHPWVFANSIEKLTPDGNDGDIVILFDRKSNKVYAVGLYDPNSVIRIKIIHHGGGVKVDKNFFREKVLKAYQIRKPLLETDTNAYRLIFGENDGMPGLIADVYANVTVLKLYSPVWLPYLNNLVGIITEINSSKSVVLRLSRKLQQSHPELKDGDILYGTLESEDVLFREYGVKFKANVIHGHKTGFFLDHRANRQQVGLMAKDKDVLDVFSYAGGFSVHALAGNARSVTSLDISSHALELAQSNAELNSHKGTHHIICGDAFDSMQKLIEEKKLYDIVIIDPPSFAKSKEEVPGAIRKYAELAELGVRLTKKEGVLLLASCSSRVTETEFKQIHPPVFKKMNVNYILEKFTTHDIDHPVTFKEGAYLKSAYYRLV